MIGRRARLELLMQAVFEKVEMLNGEERAELIIPANIGGKLTKVRHNGIYRMREGSFKITPITKYKPIVLIDTDSELTGGPKNSPQHTPTKTITESDEFEYTSDYVSTLRDPNELSYEEWCLMRKDFDLKRKL
jgi:hypothetical protein